MDFLDMLCYKSSFFLCFFVVNAFLPSFCQKNTVLKNLKNRLALPDKQIIICTFAR